jgi:hypothetical protein
MNGHDNGNAPPTPDTICDPDAPTVRLFGRGRHRLGDRPGIEKTVYDWGLGRSVRQAVAR